MDLFPHELPGLRARRFALALVSPRPLDSLAFWHDVLFLDRLLPLPLIARLSFERFFLRDRRVPVTVAFVGLCGCVRDCVTLTLRHVLIDVPRRLLWILSRHG